MPTTTTTLDTDNGNNASFSSSFTSRNMLGARKSSRLLQSAAADALGHVVLVVFSCDEQQWLNLASYHSCLVSLPSQAIEQKDTQKQLRNT